MEPSIELSFGAEADISILAARSALASSLFLASPGKPEAVASISSLSSTISAVFKLAAAGRFDLIDFSQATILNSSPQHLIAALRASSSYRDRVPTWDIGLWLAIDVCALRGINARDVLRGLL